MRIRSEVDSNSKIECLVQALAFLVQEGITESEKKRENISREQETAKGDFFHKLWNFECDKIPRINLHDYIWRIVQFGELEISCLVTAALILGNLFEDIKIQITNKNIFKLVASVFFIA